MRWWRVGPRGLTLLLSASMAGKETPSAVVSGRAQIRAQLPAGVDGWGYSLKGMMGMVVVGGLLITATYFGMQRRVVPKVQALQKVRQPSSAAHMACALRAPAQERHRRAAACLMRASALAVMFAALSQAAPLLTMLADGASGKPHQGSPAGLLLTRPRVCADGRWAS